jgi:hypothetical protein
MLLPNRVIYLSAQTDDIIGGRVVIRVIKNSPTFVTKITQFSIANPPLKMVRLKAEINSR